MTKLSRVAAEQASQRTFHSRGKAAPRNKESAARMALFQIAQGAHLLEIARGRVKLKLREKDEENARYGRKKGGVAR